MLMTTAPTTNELTPPVAIVLSPWRPTATLPYSGSFVEDFDRCARRVYGGGIASVHLDDKFQSSRSAFEKHLTAKLIQRSFAFARPDSGGCAFHVPLAVPPRSGWRSRVEAALQIGESLADLPRRMSALGLGSLPAQIHAHVGMVAGVATLPWIDDHELYVYEHASFLFDTLESDSYVRGLYERVLDSSTATVCVNPNMAETMGELFPAHRSKIGVFPNAVRFERFTSKARTAPLKRWVYIGNLKEEKGLGRLVDTFRQARMRFKDVSLTVVGLGPDSYLLDAPDIIDAIDVRPPARPSEIPQILDEADVLVHLSLKETFGLTAIEAIAAGCVVLISRTDGSSYTLSDVIDRVGTMIAQTATPQQIVDAYAELREVPGRLDLASARNDLERRFSMHALTEAVRDLTRTRVG
jgi:glycogen(starch) synthase